MEQRSKRPASRLSSLDRQNQNATSQDRLKRHIEEKRSELNSMTKAERDNLKLKPRGRGNFEKGGRMEPIIGMPVKKKLEKLKPIGPERSMQVEGIMSKMKAGAFSPSAKKLRSPGKSVAEVEKPRRKKLRRRK